MIAARPLVAAACLLVAGSASAAPGDLFETEVRPLLVEQCQKCHGPKKQESGLRLDSRAALLKGGEGGPAVVPGKPRDGTLLPAVRHAAGASAMPPGGKKLKESQVAALERWVAEGAVWPDAVAATSSQTGRDHWAFKPVADMAPPSVKDAAWPRTDIDRFVLARLEAKGLKPSADADRRTLIRRLAFDLTGLPPTPDEIAAFLDDKSPDAYEQLVDRLLASPAYGERWGRHWLDVARYADTAGDGADYPVREAHKYRDWVIDALNADLPYDRFLKDQIAGDILARDGPPERYAAGVTATGFLAVGKRYGYAPNADFQHLDFADGIDSLGRSLLGLSIGCARCHDHKYEPISAADYYALYGIFQSTKWAFPGGEEQKRPAHFPPLVPPAEAIRLDKAKADALAKFDADIARRKADRLTLEGKAWAGGVDLAFEGQTPGKPLGGAWLSQGPATVLAEAQSPFAHAHPAGTRGVRLGSGGSGDGVRHVFAQPLKATPNGEIFLTIDFRPVAEGKELGSRRFYLGRGVIASLALECSVTPTEFAVRDGAKWQKVRALTPGEWHTLGLRIDPGKKTYSGYVGRPGDLTQFSGKALGAGWDGVIDTFICDGHGHAPGKPAWLDLDNLGLQTSPFAEPGTKLPALPAPPADLKDRLAKLDAELAALTKEREAAVAREAYPVAYGVTEGVPIDARIQKRGEPDRPGDVVPRRFLDVLGGAPVAKGGGSGRRDLAEWVASSNNPLTARVFVNRVWGWHFGRGLVPTPSDFGTRGEPPSHPELLDWLAARLVKGGWSVKALHRLIVTSRVYRQASDGQQGAKTDPENRLLWKFSRRPLDAEAVRDAMMAASGTLNRERPGPHPFPPVQSWGFTIHAPFAADYDSDRRSVYLMVQRNRRQPFLALFDAADPNISAAERLPTVTPKQALFLMNSPFVHKQADAFGKRVLARPGDDTARVRWAFEATGGRPPTDAELGEALGFVRTYAGQSDPAKAWAALGRVLLTGNSLLSVD